MAVYTTIAELADRTGRDRCSLSRVARRLGIQRLGRDYLLTVSQAELVTRTLRERPGNPLFRKNFHGGKRSAARV